MTTKAVARIACAIPPELKQASEAIALAQGISISEYLRLSLLNLVAEGRVPFPHEKKFARLRRGRPPTARPAQVAA
jgi:hypothetical protein